MGVSLSHLLDQKLNQDSNMAADASQAKTLQRSKKKKKAVIKVGKAINLSQMKVGSRKTLDDSLPPLSDLE